MWSFSRRGVLRGVLTIAVLVVAGVSVLMVLEIPFAPWIRSFGLWPTLTGNWHGEMETADGRVSLAYFELRGIVPRRGGPHIYGTARWCDGTGAVWDYVISGTPDNWRGTRFRLSLRSVVERELGVSPNDLQGEWQGDEIRATAALTPHSRTATATAEESRSSSVPAGPPRVRFVLRRGDEEDFLAACRVLPDPQI